MRFFKEQMNVNANANINEKKGYRFFAFLFIA